MDRRRITAGLAGAIVGLIVAAIVAVNFVITFGPDQGYESTISEIFDENLLVGIVTLAILATGPLAGVIIAIRQRRNQS